MADRFKAKKEREANEKSAFGFNDRRGGHRGGNSGGFRGDRRY